MAAAVSKPQPPRHAREAQAAYALVRYAVVGDTRFLSHRDELRALERALARAGWPVSYSAGFNPQARVKVPLPRAVGIAAEEQLAVVVLCVERPREELAAGLRGALPTGLVPGSVVVRAERVQPHPVRETYRVVLREEAVAEVRLRAEALLARDSLLIDRDYGPKKPRRRIDVRPFIAALQVGAAELRFTLEHLDQRTARPGELLQALGIAGDHGYCVTRVAVEWDIKLPT